LKELKYDDLHFGSREFDVVQVNKFPDKCPICHLHIRPEEINSFLTKENRIEAVFQCTNDNCNRKVYK